MAKFEKPMAIKRMNEILEHCDAAMVARGDLGVEMPPEEVPIIQKRIIASCRDFGIPVVVATQMLDSMVNSPHLQGLKHLMLLQQYLTRQIV